MAVISGLSQVHNCCLDIIITTTSLYSQSIPSNPPPCLGHSMAFSVYKSVSHPSPDPQTCALPCSLASFTVVDPWLSGLAKCHSATFKLYLLRMKCYRSVIQDPFQHPRPYSRDALCPSPHLCTWLPRPSLSVLGGGVLPADHGWKVEFITA